MPWFILQLSPMGEKESSKSLTRSVKSLLGQKAEVFIPSVRGEGSGYRREFYLVDGYVFVAAATVKSLKALLSVEGEAFFEEVVTSYDEEGRREPVTLTDREIEEMRVRIQREMENPENIQVEEEVTPIDGDFRYLEGVVVGVASGMATVRFMFHSKAKDVSIPLFCLRRKGQVSQEEEIQYVTDMGETKSQGS